MLSEIKELSNQISSDLNTINSSENAEAFKLKHLVKKGTIQALLNRMKEIPKEEKREIGKELNILKKNAESKFKEITSSFAEKSNVKKIDLSLPGRTQQKGTRHPVRQTIDKMIKIFGEMGFSVAEGADIEDGYHNFDALNFPPDHPARDMQDTFFIKDPMASEDEKERELVLRTHTSPVQIRLMENMKPPIRAIIPGRVYRNEALDATHLAEFHQIEGLYIDKNVSLAELKATMMTFAKKLYGDELEFRFRPSFFPFTEPSAELDIKAKGSDKWMEVAGCGMVHPNVLKAGGVNPEVYSGYAFGFGIERITMLSTEVDDIRLMYENNVKVLEQF